MNSEELTEKERLAYATFNLKCAADPSLVASLFPLTQERLIGLEKEVKKRKKGKKRKDNADA